MPAVECSVWFAEPLEPTEARLTILDTVELERLRGYRREADQRRFLTGRTLAKTMLAKLLGGAPEDIHLDSACPECDRPHGPPRLLAPGAPVFSISHSGDRVAVALTEGPAVGIDVELITRELSDGIERHVLSPTEQGAYDDLPEEDRGRAFYTYWTRKESLVKACRRGIALPMPSITVSEPDRPAALLASAEPALDPERTTMHDLDAGPDYRACLAVLTDEPLDVHTDWYG